MLLFAYFLKHVHALVPGNHIHGTWPQPMNSENQFKEQNLSYAKIQLALLYISRASAQQ